MRALVLPTQDTHLTGSARRLRAWGLYKSLCLIPHDKYSDLPWNARSSTFSWMFHLDIEGSHLAGPVDVLALERSGGGLTVPTAALP